jgi:stearoyl-CoA desaturase (delta-9 desaturase)
MIPLTPKNLLISQIIAHMALVYMLFYGNIYWWIVSIFIYFLNGCLGMSMTYHRLLSHKSWNCPKFLEYIFVVFANSGLTGSAISWVSIHRQHHRFTDTEKDPHSPIYKSWFYCHFLSMFSKVDMKYVPDLLKQKFYITQHKYYFEISIVWGLLMVLLFQDFNALIYAWLVPAAILWNAGSSIVSISHRQGTVFNDSILAILVWGEGYHKNHHENPKNYVFGKWDIGKSIIGIIINGCNFFNNKSIRNL